MISFSEVTRVVTFPETKQDGICQGRGAYCLLGTEFGLCKVNSVPWGVADGHTARGMCLQALHSTPKMVETVKF